MKTRNLGIVFGALIGIGCTGPMGDDSGGGPGGKTDDGDDFNVPYDPSIPNIVPEQVHNYLETYQWGDYHLFFHMTRRWFVMGKSGQNWLISENEKYADLQEGDTWSGIEFLTMHTAMIEHLRGKFGEVPIEGSDEYATMDDVLIGWDTDEEVIAHLEARGINPQRFRDAAARINDYASFATEDEFGLFLQTTLRLSGRVDENDTFIRFYDQDRRVGAGIHNTLHGWFSDPESPIDVGNPQTNLSNTLFWGIHGWIEAKWQGFQQVHVRTDDEQEQYEYLLDRYRLHMRLHSDEAFGESVGHEMGDVKRCPKEVADEVAPKMLTNDIYCADVDTEGGAQMEGCIE